MTSSASMRWIWGGLRLPLLKRSTVSARFRFHRQRVLKMGVGSTACSSTSSAVLLVTYRAISSSGKLCCGPSDSTMASSLAAACSSKSKVRQKRFRRAKPKPLFTRLPLGLWTTSCIPPVSSKNRSTTMRRWLGNTLKSLRLAAR